MSANKDHEALAVKFAERARDAGGRIVRDAWIRWALTQPNPKPSWLVPYDNLSESDKEANRRIFEAVAACIISTDEKLPVFAQAERSQGVPDGWRFEASSGDYIHVTGPVGRNVVNLKIANELGMGWVYELCATLAAAPAPEADQPAPEAPDADDAASALAWMRAHAKALGLQGADGESPPGLSCFLAGFVAAPEAERAKGEAVASFQDRVAPWMAECFGAAIASDVRERGDKLLEEVLELLQSHGYDPGRVATLRDYVYGRPVGEPGQEAGGVMVTLAAYCLATGIDMHAAGEAELARIWTKVDVIRAKQASKRDIHSPLPSSPAPESPEAQHRNSMNGCPQPCDAPNGEVPCCCGAWHDKPEADAGSGAGGVDVEALASQMVDAVIITEISGFLVWCETDCTGNKHVMIQHDAPGAEPFAWCKFGYDYRYTDNATQRRYAEDMARQLGASDPIEWRTRPIGSTMNKQQWENAYAARLAFKGGLDQLNATAAAVAASQVQHEESGPDVREWARPEEAADEEMTYWDDDNDQ